MMRVIVLDPQGKPLPGANVHASVWTDEEGFQGQPGYRDRRRRGSRASRCRRRTPLFGSGEQEALRRPPHEWGAGRTVVREGASRPSTPSSSNSPATAGGRILDEKGKPVAGAKVQVSLTNDLKAAKGDGRARYAYDFAVGSDAVTTDADGRWRVTNVPDHPEAELSLLVTHPDFVSDRWSHPARTPASPRRTSGKEPRDSR